MSDVNKEEDVFLFSTDELFKLAVTYFKENEGRNFHIQFDDKLNLVALKQQASYGNISNANLPPVGALDVIGKQRRAAWSALGDMEKSEAKQSFINTLTDIVPEFQAFVNEKTKEEQEMMKKRKEEELIKVQMENEERENKERKQREEIERRKIQDALNRQTFSQFKSYAEQQYPDNPDQQAVLIKQLQEQHYYQYMQQLVQHQASIKEGEQLDDETTHVCSHSDALDQSELTPLNGHSEEKWKDSEREANELETSLSFMKVSKEGEEQEIEPEEASMWTRKDINDFKETIRKEEGDSILKVGHGEIVTVRVPTHKDGKSLYWEFATDSYDIGFGVFFEWVEAEDTQVTVHVSDSEDEEEEEDYGSDEEGGVSVDPESGKKGYIIDNGPPTSCIVPIYRRDCHEEVYAGSHNYPAQGVYLLKFDNSFSLWRSKTLYYRVYYTR